MRKKSSLHIGIAAFFCVMFSLSPPLAQAAVTADPCPAGNAIDTAAANNRSAYLQAKLQEGNNVNSMFPVVPAVNQCASQIESLFSKMPATASAASPGGGAAAALINAIVGQVCSQITSTITSAETALAGANKVCTPIPQFNPSLDLPSFTSPSCGGTSLSSSGNSPGSSAASSYNPSQYMSK